MKREPKTMSRLFATILIIVICVMCFGVSTAAESKRKNYVFGQVGMFQPDGDIDDLDFDTGLDGSFGYGRYLTQHLVVEGALDAFGTDRATSGQHDVGGFYTSDEWLIGMGGLVTLKGVVSAGPVDMFVGAGVGIYSVIWLIDVESSNLGSFGRDDSDFIFGAHAVLGANYNINQFWFVGLEGSYRWTEDAELTDTVAGIPLFYKGDLSGYSVEVTVGFRF